MSRKDLPQLITAARAAAEAGDATAAARHYKAALRLDRRNHTLLLEAGVNSAQAGDMSAARDYLIAATKVSDHSADVHFNLGHVYLDQKLYDLALRSFDRAQAIDGAYPDLDYSRAEALFGLERTQDALLSVTKATQSAPRDLDAWMLRGRCEDRLGMAGQAEQTYLHLLQLTPGHIDAQLQLARNYAKRLAFEKAINILDNIRDNKDLPNSVLVEIGDIYGSGNQAHRAIDVLQKAVERYPSDAAAHALLGSAYIDLGEFDLSERHLREALNVDATQALAYQSLADIKRLSEADRKPLESLYAARSLSDQSRIQCGFALYYLNDKADNFDAAFAALTDANKLMHQVDPHDVEANQALLARLKDIITADFLKDREGQGFDEPGPVFIVGMPRSGTTLTEQILANHPQVLAGGERNDIISMRGNISNFPDGVSDLGDGWARPAGKRVHDAMFTGSDGHLYATDKLPGNYAFLGLIKWVLPKAKFIYCRRRPEPLALSIFEQHFMTLPFSRSLADIAVVYQNHLSLMEHWREACGIEVLPVDYEDLVQDPEPVARRIYEYIGLDWKTDYLDVSKVDRQINTASRWQARQPINTSSLDRWRRYEKHLQPFVEALEQTP